MPGLLEITIGNLLNDMSSRYPDNDAVIYNDRPFRKTYLAFRSLVDEAARGFMAMGVQKGDHVAIWATNEPEWLIFMFATAKIGATMVTVNTNYKKYELEYLLKQSDSAVLAMVDTVKGNSYVEIINAVCPTLKDSKPGGLCEPNLPVLKSVIYIGNKENTPAGMFHWDALYELAKNVPESELSAREKDIDIHDVVNLQYTSGTTGFPKGVMLTHHNLVNNGFYIGECMALTPRDRLCIPVPLFHCFGCVLGVMASVTHATAMVMVDQYNAEKVMKTIQEERCTAVHGVPTMFIAMLDHPDFNQYDFSSLRTGIMAGSPCPEKVMDQVIKDMHMNEICITYGLTESSPAITMSTTTDTFEHRVATVGKCLPFVEAKIVDPETGLECPTGVPGEIMTRGYHVMKGYYNMPEATAIAIENNGWLHSGDIGTVDEDGYFKITGRLKDMIIRGGENIYPKEIESCIYTYPGVKDVQVVGVPSKKYGEEVMAYVIMSDNAPKTTEEDIKAFLQPLVARYKVPKYIRFLKEFPMTASGKIQKYKLREMAASDPEINGSGAPYEVDL